MRALVDAVGGRENLSKLAACAVVGLGIIAAAVYQQGFATEGAQSFMSRWQLDKVLHAIGGLWLSMLAGFFSATQPLRRTIAVVLAVSVLWEFYEFFLDWRTILIYRTRPIVWAVDTALDTIFALVGGLAFHRMQNRPAQASVPALLEQE